MWIVLTALRRPYTFVVLAVVIALFGMRAALLTPTDIFPNINIPVVSVVWTYNGLLPNDMSGRVIYYYERTLTAQVGDIEHIESQSLNGYGVVKIFFQKDVDIAAAMAQVTAASQTVLKLLPPGITPPYVLSYNASSVPILQLALSSKKLPQMQLFDLGQNFIRPQLATVAGAAVPSPYGGKILQVQVDLDQQAMQAHSVSADDVVNAVSVQNLILPAGDEKIGKFDWNVALNASPVMLDRINDLPVKKVNGTIIYMRDVAYVHDGSPPQTNLVRVNGARAVLMTILKAGSASTLNVIDGIKSLLPRVEESLPSSLNLTCRRRSVDLRQGRGVRRHSRGGAGRGAGRRDDPAVPRQLALDRHHPDRDSARHSVLADAAVLARRDHQRHDAGRSGARRRHSGRRRHGHDREHQLSSRAGQEIEPAILDGAQQIVIPAFVTLLCLCIVFVPMFQLGGVAGYLFRPLAEAVVFALIGSFILSRTLVPTMANYLMRGHHAPRRSRSVGSPAPPIAQSAEALSAGLRGRLRALPRRAIDALLLLALGRPKTFIAGFLACVVLSFGLWPFLGENFFPVGRFRADPDACARPARHAHRGDGASVRSGRADRPPDAFRPTSSTTSSTISACRSAASTWPTRIPARSAPRTATR